MSPNVYTPFPKFGFPLARRQLRRFATPALIALFSVLALWPTAFNRGVFLFSDSFDIVHAGDAAIAKVFPAFGLSGLFKPLETPNTRDGGRVEPIRDPSLRSAPPPPRVGAAKDTVVIAGRSVYYGLAADIAFRLGGFWILAFAQAAVGVGLLWLTCGHFGLSLASRAATLLFAIGLTSFPIYASLILPDVWAGYAILSVCALTVFGRTMSRGETGFHLAVVTFGCLSHNSIILMILAAGLALGALPAVRLARRRLRRGEREIATASATSRPGLAQAAIVCGLAVAAGLVGNGLYAHMVKMKMGLNTDSPPFMTARLVADGPGRQYLQHHCYGAHFYICGMKTPIGGDSDTILWGRLTQGGVWYRNSPDARKQMGDQDAKFALAAALHDPAGVFVSGTSNAARQLTRIDFDDILSYADVQKLLCRSTLKPVYCAKISRSRAFTGSWPKSTIEFEQMLLLTLSYAGIITILLPRGGWSDPIRKFSSDALLFVLVNAAVCGCLSGVFGRYQGRVVWVLACVVVMSCLSAPTVRTWAEQRRPRLTLRVGRR